MGLTNLKIKLQEYFKTKNEIVAVYLYGSFSKLTNRPGSDVDIGILLQMPALKSAAALTEQYMVELGRILRKDIEILVMNNAGEVILNQVFQKGILVHIGDPPVEKSFRLRSFMLYQDFKPYLRRMQKGLENYVTRNENG